MYSRTLGCIALGALTLAGCTGKTERGADSAADTTAAAAPTSPAPNVLTVTANEFAFTAPDQVPAGMTTIRLVANGKELHHVQFVKLDSGKTVDDYVQAVGKAMKGEAPPPAWATDYGGVNPPVPGGTAEITQQLEPGSYALVCFVPGPDGVPHIAKGMSRAITVTPSTAPTAPEPKSDIALNLADYTFNATPALAAGKHTIRIENTAQQTHEVILVRLAPGKRVEDLAKWIDHMQGPPPAEPLGGVPGIAPGRHVFMTVDLTPGEYGLLCEVPDAKDGKPHVAHGMMKQFTIS